MLYGFDKTKRLDASAVVHTFTHAVQIDTSKALRPWTEKLEHIANQSGKYVGMTKRGAYDCAEYLESLWRLNLAISIERNSAISQNFVGYMSRCPSYSIQNLGGEWVVEFTINDIDTIENKDGSGAQEQDILLTQDGIENRFDLLKNMVTPISYKDRLFAGV